MWNSMQPVLQARWKKKESERVWGQQKQQREETGQKWRVEQNKHKNCSAENWNKETEWKEDERVEKYGVLEKSRKII